jgi:hypothetical protein
MRIRIRWVSMVVAGMMMMGEALVVPHLLLSFIAKLGL